MITSAIEGSNIVKYGCRLRRRKHLVKADLNSPMQGMSSYAPVAVEMAVPLLERLLVEGYTKDTDGKRVSRWKGSSPAPVKRGDPRRGPIPG